MRVASAICLSFSSMKAPKRSMWCDEDADVLVSSYMCSRCWLLLSGSSNAFPRNTLQRDTASGMYVCLVFANVVSFLLLSKQAGADRIIR